MDQVVLRGGWPCVGTRSPALSGRHGAAPRAGWLPIVLLLALLGAGCDLNVTGGPPSIAATLGGPATCRRRVNAAAHCPAFRQHGGPELSGHRRRTIATPPTAVPGRRDPLSRGPYYVSPDRQVWAQDWGWTSTPGTRKMLWLKPLGAPLELRGQRLDAAVNAASGFPTGGDDQLDGFRASHLIFPTEGCWQIVAQVGYQCAAVRHVHPRRTRLIVTWTRHAGSRGVRRINHSLAGAARWLPDDGGDAGRWQSIRLDRQVGKRVDGRALRQQGANPRQRVRRVEERAHRAGGQLAPEPP